MKRTFCRKFMGNGQSAVWVFLMALTLLLAGCANQSLPKVMYYPFSISADWQFRGDTIRVALNNPLQAPLRFYIQSTQDAVQVYLDSPTPITLMAQADTTLEWIVPQTLLDTTALSISVKYGDLNKEIQAEPIGLPFASGRTYSIIQGNNGSFSHHSTWSRYAVDISLKTNDTVCAATDGYVVGLINQYTKSGSGKEWMPYANFITLYNPATGVFTSYVHLRKDGTLVQLGDWVKRGQAIGLVGLTGQTDVEHLHFSCLMPSTDKEGMRSIPFQFETGQPSEALKRGDTLRRDL
ncbi:M23 family metallopeptidase [Cytophagales bacterium LB-30]|uniref:M23 family metallopeptidase n=1 Tax=Shiella aurantiaca TaxID=3058365 RepID=A0ABT8F7V8_9BACT|nr:M23 family metallopeptidase [Shiella aurantiaca]MDN4166459.1 M23 family metallopeptidase [Shiella aurantiaca]